MSKIFTTTDTISRDVSLDESQFNNHIINHPEMINQEDCIKNTIENPDCIFESSYNSVRDVYFSKGMHNLLTEKYVKVVVDFSDPNEGFVVSAWTTDKVSTSIGACKYVK